MFSLNLRYHALTHPKLKDGRMYIHDATTGAPVSEDYSNLLPVDAESLAAALNRENGCYVQHDEHTYRLRIDRPATLRIESNAAIVCSLPVLTAGGEKARITVPARDGVHVATFVGMAIEVYDPADQTDRPIPLVPARTP